MEKQSGFVSIVDFLNNYMDGRTLEHSFLNDKWHSADEWKNATVPKVLEFLNYVPRDTPLEPAVTGRIEENGYTREDIEFNTAKGVRISGSMLIPHIGMPPYAAVIAMHDHGGFYYFGREKIMEIKDSPKELSDFKNRYYAGRSYASDLARRGYAVLCIDAFYFGSRKISLSDMPMKSKVELPKQNEISIEAYNKACGGMEAVAVKHILATGTTWPGIMFYDDRKCVDYLHTREDVDKRKIGCCGLSIGGYRSLFLAGLDSRICAAVAAGWMTTYRSMNLDGVLNHTFMVYVPGLSSCMELPDIAGLTVPRALFVQQCARDDLFGEKAMREACAWTQAIYKKAGCPDKFRYNHYDNGHEFNAQMQEDAFAWLDNWLKERNDK